MIVGKWGNKDSISSLWRLHVEDKEFHIRHSISTNIFRTFFEWRNKQKTVEKERNSKTNQSHWKPLSQFLRLYFNSNSPTSILPDETMNPVMGQDGRAHLSDDLLNICQGWCRATPHFSLRCCRCCLRSLAYYCLHCRQEVQGVDGDLMEMNELNKWPSMHLTWLFPFQQPASQSPSPFNMDSRGRWWKTSNDKEYKS